jgi:NAD-dependent DNA ligase
MLFDALQDEYDDDDDDDDDESYRDGDDDDEEYGKPAKRRRVEPVARAAPKAKAKATRTAPGRATAGAVLAGTTICITGTLSRVRREIEADIRKHGGGIATSVTGSVTHLLIGDDANGTAKHNAALDRGVPIVDEDWLLAKISGQEEE